MTKKTLTPRENPTCQYSFTCAATICPPDSTKKECYINRFDRYQPSWHERNWEDLKSITWHDVFSLKEKLVYTLIIILISVFIFFMAILIKITIELQPPI